jgi:hypothetical protein
LLIKPNHQDTKTAPKRLIHQSIESLIHLKERGKGRSMSQRINDPDKSIEEPLG